MSPQHDAVWALRVSEERHRLLAESANDVIWTMSVTGEITYVSPSVELMRGITPEVACAQQIDEIHPPESAAVSLGYFTRLYELLAAGLPPEDFRGELEYYCKDGSTVWTEVHVIPHVDSDGQLIEILGVTRDISERRQREAELRAAREAAEQAMRDLEVANAELERQARIDPLTGAWNRRHIEESARRQMALARRYGHSLSLLLLDVDRFKSVNDSRGHQVGDQVLVELVGRIGHRLRECDELARWGGEEFLILTPSIASTGADSLALQLVDLVSDEVFEDAGPVSISVGSAEYRHDESFDDWVRRADVALYAAKAAGRGTARNADDLGDASSAGVLGGN